MATGYTRQHAAEITDQAVIEAAHFNDEYNAIQSAFNASTGHNHDGTAGGGAQISTNSLANDSITNPKLANMAQNTVKGRISAGSGDPEDITATDLVNIIKNADGASSGLDADLLDGMQPATTATANTIVQRDASGSITGTEIISSQTVPVVQLYDTDAATDHKRWRFMADNGAFALQTVNDAYTAASNIMTASRSGNSGVSATFQVPLTVSGSVAASSSSNPQIVLNETDGLADQKRWAMWISDTSGATPGTLNIGPQTDAGAGSAKMTMDRAGTTTFPGVVSAGDFQIGGSPVVTDSNFSSKVRTVSGNLLANKTISNTTGVAGLEVQAQGQADPTNVGAALITFHRPQNTAMYFGVDTDNKLKIGGWSLGANAYEIMHMGNSAWLTPYFNGVKFDASSEKHISWDTATTSYGLWGTTSALGAFDWTNSRHIWRYDPAQNTFTVSPKLLVGSGIIADGGVTVGGSMATQFPLGLSVAESTHATSRRAGMSLGDWVLAQDTAGNGTKSFGLFQTSGNDWAYTVGTDRSFDFKKNPTVNGKLLLDTSNATMSFRNMVHNARVNILQRGSGPTNSGGFLADRWNFSINQVNQMQHQVLVDTNNPASRWLEIKVNTATASPGTDAFVFLGQCLEPIDTAALSWGTANAKPITVSFRYQSSTAAKYAFFIRNDVQYNAANNGTANNATYVATFDVIAGEGTVKLTIPGPTTGYGTVWGNSAFNVGLGFGITLCSGNSTGLISSSVNAWNYGSGAINVAGTNNLCATANAYFRVTDITMEPGNYASPISALDVPFIYEFARCQRYFQTTRLCNFGNAGSADWWNRSLITLRVPMRATPSYNANYSWETVNIASEGFDMADNQGASHWIRSSTSGVFSRIVQVLAVAEI